MPDPRFREGWPDAFIGAYQLTRALVETSLDLDEPGLSWKIYPALFEVDDDADNAPTVAIVGDLTVWAGTHWAGVRAHTDLFIKDLPRLTDDEWQTANELAKRHAGWLQHGLYDYVAAAMRTMIAGGVPLAVPRTTPDYDLKLVEVDEHEGGHEGRGDA